MAKFKRTGLHRLECPTCPCYGYFTVAMLEAAGQLPSCFTRGCGERLQPARIELALMLGAMAADAPVMVAYERKVHSVAHGQAWSRKGQASPEMRAAEIIAAEQRKAARQRRIQALMPTPDPMPF